MSVSAADLALHRNAPVTDGVLPVDAPLRVDDVDKAHWDARCDVLVVGFGGAGAAAAIAATMTSCL